MSDYLEFGFPLGINYSLPIESTLKNHKSAFDHCKVDKFVHKELDFQGISGPFSTSPFWSPKISPLMTAPKKPDSRRICFDLTFGEHSVNNATPHWEFLGEPYTNSYPKADEFEDLIIKHGPNCLLWKTDLSRFFMQLPVDPHDYPYLCFIWRNCLFHYINLPYGHRNSGMHGQKITTAEPLYIFLKNSAFHMMV